MAEITAFHFKPGDSFLHKTDTRIKFISMLILTVSVLNTNPWGLGGITAALIALVIHCSRHSQGKKAAEVLKDFRPFILLFSVIIISRGILTPGSSIIVILPGNQQVFHRNEFIIPFLSLEGTAAGGMYVWKLAVSILLGQLFTMTTDPQDLSMGIYHMLRFLPGTSARRFSTMAGLTISFIPVIFDEYREIKDAFIARMGNRRRNPLRAVAAITVPLIQGIMFRADEISSAMIARMYNEQPHGDPDPIPFKDGILLTIVLLTAVSLYLFPRLLRFS